MLKKNTGMTSKRVVYRERGISIAKILHLKCEEDSLPSKPTAISSVFLMFSIFLFTFLSPDLCEIMRSLFETM